MKLQQELEQARKDRDRYFNFALTAGALSLGLALGITFAVSF